MPPERISEHVWWLRPGPPDRPSLCAVVGERWTLALDAGSSRAHTRELLAGLPERPAAVAYTHAHWDHVFGGVEIGGLVIAHTLTARRLEELALVDWTDEANVSDTIRQELPAPRVVEIAPATSSSRNRSTSTSAASVWPSSTSVATTATTRA
jgi:glyoxylase-like metal-dependent hydrolase (beta-lactamase superfamily II)